MRVDAIFARNIGLFDEVNINLRDVEGVIAVEGENGAGKSTFLELIPGAMWRKLPTRGRRGQLADIAQGRDAMLEVALQHAGKAWTLRHTIDAVGERGESVALDGAGAPAFDSAKRRAFDAWAEATLMPPEVFFAGQFASAGTGRSFIELPAGDRKAVLLRLLGVEHLERVAERARARRDDAGKEADVHRRVLRGLESTLAFESLEAAELEVERAAKGVEELEVKTKAAEVDVQGERDKLSKWEAAKADLQRRSLEQMSVAAETQVAQEQLRSQRQVLANNEELRGEIDAVLRAEAELPAVEKSVTEAVVELADVERRSVEARARAEAAKRAAIMGAQTLANVDKSIDQARNGLSAKLEVERAVATLPELQRAVDSAEAAVESADAEEKRLREEAQQGADKRIVRLREALNTIAWDDMDEQHGSRIASDALTNDSAFVTRAKALPKLVTDASKVTNEARGHARAAQTRRSDAASVARRAGEMEQLKADLAEYIASRPTLVADAEVAAEDARVLQAQALACGQEIARADAKVAAARTMLETTRSKARRADAARKNAARIEELKARIAALERSLAVLEGRRADVPELESLGRKPEPEVAAQHVDYLRNETAKAQKRATQVLQDATRAKETLAKVEAERSVLAREELNVGHWTHMAAALGRDGIQAMEIDAAGPELGERMNDLLRACISHRWTARIDTQRASSDGKKLIEECEVTIVDSATGYEGPAHGLSSGERAIVGEALALALSSMQMDRAGVRGATLVRDETAGPLAPGWVQPYVSMLRRARELCGAAHVLFVCHQPGASDFADHRILIADRKVRLV